MSGGRWAAVAALCCLTIGVAYLPPQPERIAPWSPDVTQSPELARVQLLDRAYHANEWLLTSLRLRDSLRTALSAAHMPPGVVVQVHGSLQAGAERRFRAAVEDAWRRAHTTDNGIRLLVRLDTRPRGWSVQYILPPALDGHTCVVSTTLDWQIEWLRDRSASRGGTPLDQWLRRHLGPCLYFGAFGTPGPFIAEWLERASYRLASNADWTTPVLPLRVHDDPQLFGEITASMTLDALACSAPGGQVARCAAAIDDADSPPLWRARSEVSVPGVFQYRYWSDRLAHDDRLLASLVREMGRDRFSSFWRSTAPVDSAFRAAFGQPLDQWTARWARAGLPDFPPFGPAPRPIAIVFALPLGIVALAGAVAVATRRQVS